ncbi:MFS transporter [Kaistia defluvii]|uniref:MFS transporter n=1 Tax=Kaistia defluvii TaxID=410841 RepID=UPI00224F27F0|nr:MFS transporter [Kaistia defluvii]MCX5517000.1 MFS transporter [Kaistia defluvii]
MSHAIALAPRPEAEARAEPKPVPVQKPAAVAPPAPPAAPAFVPMPPLRAAIYAGASLLLGLTQGLGLNLVSANLTGLQGPLHATQIEIAWLTAAYMATNITGTMLLYKVRTQFGLRRFAEIGLTIYALVTIAHLFSNDLRSALAVRAVMGIAAAPLSTLAFYYMLEWLPPARKLTLGVTFGVLGGQLAVPIARVISPDLLELGDWHGLYLIEAGLAMLSLAVIYILPITHPPRVKVFDREDWISFPLIAAGFGSTAIILSVGRLYWWFEAPWIGVLLAVAIASLTLVVIIEWHRAHPIIDLRWLSSFDMLTLTGSLLLFRFLLSEQSVGAIGLFSSIGMQNEQLIPLFTVILAATLAGYLFTACVISPANGPRLHLAALILIAVAAWLDSRVTNLTRPEQFYVSQAMVAFAGALFLPPALLVGFGKAIAKGPMGILSFLVVFLGTQSMGGILASAILGTFQTMREKFHSSVIVEHLTLQDPLVVQRIRAYGAAYSRVLPDPALQNAEGVVTLGKLASQEASILAYQDMFLLIFYVALAGIALLAAHTAYVRYRTNRLAALAPA